MDLLYKTKEAPVKKTNYKRALLTGANGFIGRPLLIHLLVSGWEVNILSSSGLIPEYLPTGSRVKLFSIDDSSIQIAATDIDAYFNFSVAYDVPGITIEQLKQTNSDLPLKILHAIIKNNNESVACVLGDTFYRKFPLDSTLRPNYVKSKNLLVEGLREIVPKNDKSIRVALLIIEQVYGEGEKLYKAYPKVICQMLDQTVCNIPLTSCSQSRDFIYVTDVVLAAILVAEEKWNGLLEIDCGSGKATGLRYVFTHLAELTKTKANLGFGELSPHQYIDESKGDIRTLSSFGWKPKISLEAGLAAMVADVRLRISREGSPK
jgi:nucleoside-diphosphate-sugar epimerase